MIESSTSTLTHLFRIEIEDKGDIFLLPPDWLNTGCTGALLKFWNIFYTFYLFSKIEHIDQESTITPCLRSADAWKTWETHNKSNSFTNMFIGLYFFKSNCLHTQYLYAFLLSWPASVQPMKMFRHTRRNFLARVTKKSCAPEPSFSVESQQAKPFISSKSPPKWTCLHYCVSQFRHA